MGLQYVGEVRAIEKSSSSTTTCNKGRSTKRARTIKKKVEQKKKTTVSKLYTLPEPPALAIPVPKLPTQKSSTLKSVEDQKSISKETLLAPEEIVDDT